MSDVFLSLSGPIHQTFLGVAIALLSANVVLFFRRRMSGKRGDPKVAQRIRTWWITLAIFVVMLSVSQTTAVAFFAFVSFIAFKEFLSLIPTRRADHRVLFWAYLAIPLQYLCVGTHWFGMFVIFIPVYMFMWLPTRMVLIGETKGFLRAIGTVQWGLMTTVFSLSHAAMLLAITPVTTARVAANWPTDLSKESCGAALLVFLVVLTQFNDAAQFCWGKSIGKTPLLPKVSPSKTVGGLVGGIISTVILSGLVGPWLTLMDLPRSLLAGLIIGLAGFAGDISIAAFKRDLGVDENAGSLPGHATTLDRVDSLTYTAPLFFHFIYYCYG
ncbi:phosphatidate cytidylyltransferase [Stieleria sp. TO1_6]|uniref:phosphatidate cytidylyltransferase n=1 Tax=Stieleria tagensis TaxID=2956795 RepID=UPI00209A75F8|nr:phosphatidate cytidylyltransferase [Stieleria tagensis]MCO8120320.1 phosphatidate cytidylyltransferase [Stieleria tagensis]